MRSLAQVYQLPMEWRGRFADMLEELEAGSSQLGVTHYAVSMPTLEEVFLRCTAESHQRDGDPSPTDASAASTDGRCEITLTPQSKQSLPASPSPDSPGSAAAGSSGQASSAASPVGSDGSGPSEGASGSRPASSDGGEGNAAEDSDGPSGPLPISRDDSAEALSSVLATAADEAAGEQAKTPERSGHAAGTSRQRSQDTPLSEASQDAASKGERAGASAVRAAADCAARVSEKGAGEAQCIEDVPMEEVPLHEPAPKQRSRRDRWLVAFREMLRKRAIIAGERAGAPLLEHPYPCLRTF